MNQTTMTAIDTADLIRWLQDFAARIEGAQQGLSDLDAATGDADHGANLGRGMAAVSALIAGADDHGTPGAFLKEVGLAIVGTVGGSSGALYGTIFLRLAATAGMTAATITPPVMAKALAAASQGIVDRGRARPGDKTMLDAFSPAANAFAGVIESGGTLPAAWDAAAQAAAAGAAATTAMRARRGKSSYVGDLSIGTVDPGAASVSILFASAAKVMNSTS
jgi:dihydroxyacetone kinase-like protein